MENINSIIAEYIAAHEEKTAAEKREKAAREKLLSYANGAPSFMTDVYNVILKTSPTTRINTAALKKDFPEIYDVYGTTSTRTTITAVPRADVVEKTA